jgi:DNA-binding NtrC family response regulator
MGVHVLVVEDDQLIQRLLERMLSGIATVCTAGDATEALAQLAAFRFDVVIADLELGDPKRDGQWLLEQVHAQQPAARRLLISGHREPLHAADRDTRIVTLHKPFRSEELVAAVAG